VQHEGSKKYIKILIRELSCERLPGDLYLDLFMILAWSLERQVVGARAGLSRFNFGFPDGIFGHIYECLGFISTGTLFINP